MSLFPHLFSPITINQLQLKNRGMMPPMVTNQCADNGEVTDQFIAYHVARAKGGVALNITEAAYVEPLGKGFPNQFGFDSDHLLPGLRRLTDAVHAAGGLIGVQLYHGGRQANAMVTGGTVVAPSPIPCPVMQTMPHELTIEEIADLVATFAAAGARAKAAGFDLIEIHGAHGYLLNEFLSPHTNKRTDEYGQDRGRFPLEVVDAIRAAVGSDFALQYRISADELLPDGLTVADTSAFCVDLVEHCIDSISVSGCTYEVNKVIAGPEDALGFFVADAAAIKEAIGGAVPVAVANRIKTPEFAEQVLADGRVDLVATGRPLLCDPEFYNKAREGRADEIRVCLSCNFCASELNMGRKVRCLCNPLTGEESRYDLAAQPQRRLDLVVVGGGLAGMEAAHTAAARGHHVRLFEASDQLGGNVLPGVRPPLKSEMFGCVDYETKALARTGVEVSLRDPVDADSLAALKADQVIIATGSNPIVPGLAGIDLPHVHPAEDVLLDRVELGRRVVIIGAGSVGVETAELLTERGKDVTLVEMAEQILRDMEPPMAMPLLARLAQTPTRVLTGERVERITDSEVVTDKQAIPADTVIVAVGYAADRALADELDARGIEYVLIGDAVKPRKIRDAIVEGFEAGLRAGV